MKPFFGTTSDVAMLDGGRPGGLEAAIEHPLAG